MRTELSPCEAKYYVMLNSGELFKLDPTFTGILSDDWDKWIVYFKKYN
jgi:hypothetical protein